MKFIVCLGNPGPEYVRHRHNVGFRVGEALANALGFSKQGNKFKSCVYQGRVHTESTLLLFPQTFMNLSGDAVVAALHFYKAPISDLLVIYDDFDIPFGTLRLREKGSPGTHNGMKDIVRKLASNEFFRLRIGIGPKPERGDVSDFVLADFSKQEEAALPDVFQKAIQTIQEIYA